MSISTEDLATHPNYKRPSMSALTTPLRQGALKRTRTRPSGSATTASCAKGGRSRQRQTARVACGRGRRRSSRPGGASQTPSPLAAACRALDHRPGERGGAPKQWFNTGCRRRLIVRMPVGSTVSPRGLIPVAQVAKARQEHAQSHLRLGSGKIYLDSLRRSPNVPTSS